MRGKKLASIVATVALSFSAAPAMAAPDFGPGNSSKGPKDSGAKCHAPSHGTGPGIHDPVPGCKGK